MLKYQWLTEQLRDLIHEYILEGKTKIPSEDMLSEKYKMSRQTVRKSLSLLEEEGQIIKVQGSASIITGLMSKQDANKIHIILSEDSEYIYPGIIEDIKVTLSNLKYNCKVFVTHNRIDREREILQEILESPPRGLIVEGSKSALPNPNIDLYDRLEEEGCILLFLHNQYKEMKHTLYIKDDNLKGSSLLVEYLQELGHTQIAGIFKSDDQQGLERYQGFTDALISSDLPLSDDNIHWYNSREMDSLVKYGDTSFLKKMHKSLDSCTACICYNDQIAYYLVKELKSQGRHLPEDLAIATFDHTYLNKSSFHAVASLSHENHIMGQKAALMITGRLKGLHIRPILVPFELHKST